MSEVKHGIKETKEVIHLAFVLAAVISSELKDGFQLQDLMDIFTKMQGDEAKKAILEAALKDIKMVPAEVKDIDFMEVAELIAFTAPEVVALVNALKAE